MSSEKPLDFALTTLRHLPDPFLLVDDEYCISFLNIAAEELLETKLDHVYRRSAREVLNLREAHHLVHGETSVSWVNHGRLEFRVSEYQVSLEHKWWHLALSYPGGKHLRKPQRPQLHSESSMEEIEFANDGTVQQLEHGVNDDFWKGERLENMLENLPTIVVAVSKDGAHVYQNRMAFDTLGSVRWSRTGGLTSW